MNTKDISPVRTKSADQKVLIKKCHCCGHINESFQEPQRCSKCNKSFLPSNYFSKVHAKNEKEFELLFSNSEELEDYDLIRGIAVLW